MQGKKNKSNSNGGLVYSTNPDFSLESDDFDESSSIQPGKQNLRIWLERLKGDKKATVIKGYSGNEDEMEILLKKLKTKCACGGTAKDGNIILQGDVRKQAGEVLRKEGFSFKLAGG